MRSVDVVDRILDDERLPARGNLAQQVLDGTLGAFDQRGDVILMHSALIHHLRPGPDAKHHTPLSPHEIERLRLGLRVILDAIEFAYAKKPAHFYVVPEGSR